MRALAATVLGALALGCPSTGPTSANSPSQMFEALIEKPVPAEVTRLEGVGDTWQGYSIFLRFEGSPELIARLTAGLEPVACDSIDSRFTLPQGYDRFEGGWAPPLDSATCYELDAKNDWTHQGQHWLAIEGSVVYFAGIGA